MLFPKLAFDMINSYVRRSVKRPIESNETGQDKRLRNQTSGPMRARQDDRRYAYVPQPSENTSESIIRELQDTLYQRDRELERERHRYKSLEGNLRKAQTEVKKLKMLKSESNTSDDKYTDILYDVLVPYAQHKGLPANKRNGEPLEDVSEALLKDALQTIDAQSNERKWQKDALEVRKENKSLRQQEQVLLKKLEDTQARNRTLRTRIPINDPQLQPLRGQNEALQEQNNLLREQIQILQKDALDKVDKFVVLSDDQLEREFRSLASSIKTFSRLIRLVDQDDIDLALNLPQFLSDVSPRHWKGQARKNVFVEAWMWAALIELLFRNPFAVFGSQCKHLIDTWTQIFGKDHQHSWPTPKPLCEQWRCTTATQLSELKDENVKTNSDDATMSKETKPTTDDPREELANLLETHLMNVAQNTNFSQIRTIVNKAFALSTRMLLERCRLQITFPSTGSKFAANKMTSLPDRNGEDVLDGVVAFVVNPGLTKWGDARGLQLDQRNDIVPSLVQLEPYMPVKSKNLSEKRPEGCVTAGVAGQLEMLGLVSPTPQPQNGAQPTIKQEPE